MTVRYRRTRPSKADALAAVAVSVTVGAGVAAVTFYLARLFCSLEPMAGGRLRRGNQRSADDVASSASED